jgi:2-amino-4-hydroxy-6-hydroxymethyldihydropteridine diphosphokinase
MNSAVIGVGSNVEPEKNVEAALALLSKEQKVLAASRQKRTSPRGLENQPDFINCAFLMETKLDRAALADYLKGVESRLGRKRTGEKDAPRSIDLDIIVFNGEVVGPDFERYDFVRDSVLELLPELGIA